MSPCLFLRSPRLVTHQVPAFWAASVAAIASLGAALAGCASGPPPIVETGPMVTHEQAGQLDYRVAWQSAVSITRAGRVNTLLAFDDFVITTETGSNVVCALTARDGQPAWETPVGDRLEKLLGVQRAGDVLVASTQSDLYLIDVASGRITSHQKYDNANLAATAPVLLGNFAVYGSIDGRIIYHHIGLGLMNSAYRFDAPLSMPPFWAGSSLGVITRVGTIHLMDPVHLSRYWTNRVQDPVEATPAADENAIYIAGLDQSLWAFRVADGKRMWRYRAQQPLRDSPTLIGDIVYQGIPGQGLTALDATTGQVRWIATDVPGGTVLARRNGQLIVWDADDAPGAFGSTWYRVDERQGALVGSASCPWISMAVADKLEGGSLYGLSKRTGRIVKLDP